MARGRRGVDDPKKVVSYRIEPALADELSKARCESASACVNHLLKWVKAAHPEKWREVMEAYNTYYM